MTAWRPLRPAALLVAIAFSLVLPPFVSEVEANKFISAPKTPPKALETRPQNPRDGVPGSRPGPAFESDAPGLSPGPPYARETRDMIDLLRNIPLSGGSGILIMDPDLRRRLEVRIQEDFARQQQQLRDAERRSEEQLRRAEDEARSWRVPSEYGRRLLDGLSPEEADGVRAMVDRDLLLQSLDPGSWRVPEDLSLSEVMRGLDLMHRTLPGDPAMALFMEEPAFGEQEIDAIRAAWGDRPIFEAPREEALEDFIRAHAQASRGGTLIVVGHVVAGNFIVETASGETLRFGVADMLAKAAMHGLILFPVACKTAEAGVPIGFLDHFKTNGSVAFLREIPLEGARLGDVMRGYLLASDGELLIDLKDLTGMIEMRVQVPPAEEPAIGGGGNGGRGRDGQGSGGQGPAGRSAPEAGPPIALVRFAPELLYVSDPEGPESGSDGPSGNGPCRAGPDERRLDASGRPVPCPSAEGVVRVPGTSTRVAREPSLRLARTDVQGLDAARAERDRAVGRRLAELDAEMDRQLPWIQRERQVKILRSPVSWLLAWAALTAVAAGGHALLRTSPWAHRKRRRRALVDALGTARLWLVVLGIGLVPILLFQIFPATTLIMGTLVLGGIIHLLLSKTPSRTTP